MIPEFSTVIVTVALLVHNSIYYMYKSYNCIASNESYSGWATIDFNSIMWFS